MIISGILGRKKWKKWGKNRKNWVLELFWEEKNGKIGY